MGSLPTEFLPFGHVVGRVIRAVADTTADDDADPEAIPVTGTGLVRFTPADTHRVVTSTVPDSWVAHEVIAADLDADGVLAVGDHQGVSLYPGVWTVSPGSPTRFSFPPFTIEVTAAHTAADPLEVWSAAPWTPGPGDVVTTLVVPPGPIAGQSLGWDGDALAWVTPTLTPSATTLDAGSAATATIAGAWPDLSLTLGIPRGASGGGLSQVAHDSSLTGAGTVGIPLAVTDTGFRNISGMLATGWTAAALKVRRWGAVVHFIAVGLTAGSDATTNVMNTPLPVGFTPPHSSPATGSVSGGVGAITVGNAGQIIAATSTSQFSGTAVWTTTDPWPTTLPGAPA